MGLLNGAPETLFKHFKFNNYSFKESTITISNTFITKKNVLKTYYLKCLKNVANIR